LARARSFEAKARPSESLISATSDGEGERSCQPRWREVANFVLARLSPRGRLLQSLPSEELK